MSKTIILSLSLILIGFFSLSTSCTSDKLPEPEPPEFCDTLQVSYNLQVKEIIDTNCAFPGCHVAGSRAPGNFTDFSGLSPFLTDSEFRRFVIDLRNDPRLRYAAKLANEPRPYGPDSRRI